MSERGESMAATPFRAPVEEVLLDLEVAGLDEVLGCAAFAGIDKATVTDALQGLGRFAEAVVAPTDAVGDRVGARLDAGSGRVVLPEPMVAAYRRYVEAGWGALQFPAEHGGGGLPGCVGLAGQELLAGANLSLSLNPVLTQSAIELLLAWGDEDQRRRYVPRLLTGEWCGTMNLTEPEAGSDLGAVSARAERGADGTWKLSGTKIFITWGEHELSENIVHLVLARTPGSPAGTRGISLFVVPKYLVGATGELGERNAVRVERLEHKLGIHASPTCVMSYDKAVAELVGPERAGMRAMFTMMNLARVAIGVQGPAVGERAYQQALGYARERRQGRAKGAGEGTPSSIIEHPDVRRMLLTMRTSVLGSRLLAYRAATSGDLARHGDDERGRTEAQALVDLLTPLAKSLASDSGFAVASLGMQVLGGVGYVEETGMAQRLRDARIAPIYEGTNGIQAIDLVTRKLPRDDGLVARHVIAGVVETARRARTALPVTSEILAESAAILTETTSWLLDRVEAQLEDVLAGASAYCELLGTTLAGQLLAERALRGAERLAAPRSGAEAAAANGESEFFAGETLARATGLRRLVTGGAARLAALTPTEPAS